MLDEPGYVKKGAVAPGDVVSGHVSPDMPGFEFYA